MRVDANYRYTYTCFYSLLSPGELVNLCGFVTWRCLRRMRSGCVIGEVMWRRMVINLSGDHDKSDSKHHMILRRRRK